jgi:hypothetical protein
VEARVRTDQIDEVPFAVMMTSEGKVYVPAPKVPPVVVITPVPELYEITDAPESEEEETLFWKLVQSVVDRQPKVAADAVLQVSVPLVVLSPAPIALKVVPLSVMRFVASPWIVPVAETKRVEVVATPVVVLLVKVAPEPVTLPEAERFVVLMFPPWILFALMLPVKVEVAVPVTRSAPLVVVPETARFEVVAVPETMRFEVEAVPEFVSVVEYKLVVVADCDTKRSPLTSSVARVEVAAAPIRT